MNPNYSHARTTPSQIHSRSSLNKPRIKPRITVTRDETMKQTKTHENMNGMKIESITEGTQLVKTLSLMTRSITKINNVVTYV